MEKSLNKGCQLFKSWQPSAQIYFYSKRTNNRDFDFAETLNTSGFSLEYCLLKVEY